MNEILYVLRISHKKNESELAQLLGIPLEFYQKMEAGEVDVTLALATVLGKEYNVDPSFFPLKKNSVVNYNKGNSYNIVINPHKYFAQPTKEQIEEEAATK